MKKTILISLVFCMLFALCACGSYTSTYTETVTENGVTTTTTTTNNNGQVTTETTQSVVYPEGSCGALAGDGEVHTVPITLENELGEDITGFYLSYDEDAEFSNLFPDGLVVEDGEIADILTLNYASDYLNWYFGVQNPEGEWIHFSPMDISTLDADGFTLTLLQSDTGYAWSIDKSYCK